MNIRGLARLSFLTTKLGARTNPAVRQEQINERLVNKIDSVAAKSRAVDHNRPEEAVEKGQALGRQRLRYQHELALLLKNQDVNNGADQVSSDTAQVQESASVSTEVAGEISLRDLATQYVAQYQRNSDTKLNKEEYQQRIEEVYQFYSQPSRAGRLEQIVFE